jgi:hypothetical protein
LRKPGSVALRDRAVVTAFMALLGPAVLCSATAAAQTKSGLATYHVFAEAQSSGPLCPGQQLAIRVGVDQRTRPSGSTAVVTRSMPNAQIWGVVANPAIGSLNTTMAHTGPTQGGAGAGSYYTTFVFTAKKIGQTVINFTGQFWPNLAQPDIQSLAASPAPAVTVTVACDFSISLYSAWRLPGDRVLDVLGVVQSAKVTPDETGKFSTAATMSSSAAWMGPCPGASRIQHSQVRISGELNVFQTTLTSLTLRIGYDPVSSTTTEGCMGKSRADEGTPDRLVLYLDADGETRTTSHVLNTYVLATGTTTVVLRRLSP